MARTLRILPVAALAALALAAPAAAQVSPGGDSVTSDNVTHLGSFKPMGDGVGARIIGNTMYATSTTGLFVFDVSDPENPKQLGNFTVDVEFENEDVPTNGKILGISAGTFGVQCGPTDATGCLNLYDVTDPANIKLIKTVTGVGAHTMECVLDCTWFYGSEGQIVDARDPKNAKVIEESWSEQAIEQGYEVTAVSASPHDVTEVAPGWVLTSSNPIVLMSLRPEEGGSPEHPVVIASGEADDGRFVHSILWPRKGRDKFVLVGGESVLGPVGNGGGPCNDTVAAFMTWDGSKVRDGNGGFLRGGKFSLIDETRPYNGNYADGGHPVDAFGCSTHWFAEHPTFQNGGLVAVSAYEHGTRLFRVDPDGKMTEEGFALPIAGATSAPHWAPGGKVFYTLDYQRGMDIWSYDGPTFPGPADGAAASGGGKTGSGSSGAGALGLSIKAARTSLRKLAAKGLAVKVTCSRACTLTGKLAKGRKAIARAKAKGVTSTTLRFKLAKKAARNLRRAKAARLALTITARAADGRSATARQTLKLKR
jgi:hypothetical protein